MMAAPTEIYTPPPTLFSSLLIARTSLRNALFSAELIADLSIALISSNLASKASASGDSTVSLSVIETLAGATAASVCVGINDNMKNAAIAVRIIFFILFAIFWKNFTIQKSSTSSKKALYNSEKELHHSHILKRNAPFFLEVLEEGRSQAGDLFKLGGKMRYAAVVQAVGYFGKGKFIVQ